MEIAWPLVCKWLGCVVSQRRTEGDGGTFFWGVLEKRSEIQCKLSKVMVLNGEEGWDFIIIILPPMGWEIKRITGDWRVQGSWGKSLLFLFFPFYILFFVLYECVNSLVCGGRLHPLCLDPFPFLCSSPFSFLSVDVCWPCSGGIRFSYNKYGVTPEGSPQCCYIIGVSKEERQEVRE